MKKQKVRAVGWTGVSVEDLDVTDLLRAKVNRGHLLMI